MARFLKMKLEKKGVLKVKLAGIIEVSPADMKIYERISKRITDRKRKSLTALHFDFSEIEYVTDPGVGLLIKLYVEAKKMGISEVRFLKTKPRQKEKFRQMGIDMVFIID